MAIGKWKYLDEHLRLRLADLDPRLFEEFFLHFLRAGISLSVERHGKLLTKRVISAETYAAGSGRNQKGIDLRVRVEGTQGDKEVWVFQCKRHKTWSSAQTREAIQKASQYQAQHYFLVVACDPHEEVQDEIHKYPNWTFWNLDTICAEFRLSVPPSKHAQVLFFLSPEELKRFVPFTTEAMLGPEQFFERFIGEDKPFRHDWKLAGRQAELQGLRDFLARPHQVQVLVAKGGDGKSRLLREFCERLAAEETRTEILCLNPHRRGDDLSFAFLGDPKRRIVIVDDAHRTDQVPLQLLALVREDSEKRVSKIILATRPQGIEALAQKLYEAGLADSLAPQITLSTLKKTEVQALAREALGNEAAEHAAALAVLTSDSPFLTVVAGQLVRQGRIEWGKWASNEEFHQHVFREFEQTNLEIVTASDRDIASGLLRLLALLAPVVAGPRFLEAAARCFGCSVYSLETQLLRLRQIEIVVGRDDGLRIVPDLFADSLVYDTCYQPGRKMPGFVQQILREFGDCSAALLRNLSEAAWVARANGIADEALLETVMAPERRRFEAASFYHRAEMLRHWNSFSIYLPAESLDLASRALENGTAPPETNEWAVVFGGKEIDSHAYVREQLPALLKPIAKYHERHRRAALDLLWELGLTRKGAELGANQNHPWAVIADVIKFEPKKGVSVTLDALGWLDQQVRKPNALEHLEGTAPILRALLSPCFDRIVEFTQCAGRSIQCWRQPVSITKTEPIRDGALAILEWVVEHGSWLAALDALSALEVGVSRVAELHTQPPKDQVRFREEWRPERLKALKVYGKAIAVHSSVAIRFEIRRTLQQILTGEEDAIFAAECRHVLERVPDDLALRIAVVILSQGAFEFDEEVDAPHTSGQPDRVEGLWNERIRDTASDLAANCSDANDLFTFLQPLANELVQAGNHLFLAPLFVELAYSAPALAKGLARTILAAGAETPLAREWPDLLEKNSQITDEERLELFDRAAHRPIAGASAAVIRTFAWRARQDQALGAAETALLLDIAAGATLDEAYSLLQLIQWSSAANLPLAFRILETLPIHQVAPQMLGSVLTALAPYKERETRTPRATVERVLKQLVVVRDLDLYRHGREWNALIEEYPREIYELIRKRIALSASGQAEARYRPVPSGYHTRFHFSALARDPDFPAICDDLWQRVLSSNEESRRPWVPLFQAVVFERVSAWLPRLLRDIETAPTEDTLLWLAQLLCFEGSLILFRFPELTRAFLRHAVALGGNPLCEKVRAELYSGSGPRGRFYSGGTLDQETDYVEAEAVKAAEGHAADELLGPFYRWIVAVEQKERLLHKMRADAAMSALDCVS